MTAQKFMRWLCDTNKPATCHHLTASAAAASSATYLLLPRNLLHLLILDFFTCSETQRAHYPWHSQHSQHYQPNPYLQHGRPLLAAASNHNGGAYASTPSGHSGYG